MYFNYIAEIIANQISIYAILCCLFRFKPHKIYYLLCPTTNLLIISLLILFDFSGILHLLAYIFLYFIQPYIVISNVKFRTTLYYCLLSVGLFSMVNALPVFICSVTKLPNSSALCLAIYAILVFALIFALKNKRTSSVIVKFLSISVTLKVFILLFIWSLFILICVLTTFLSADSKPVFLVIFSLIFIAIMVILFSIFYLLVNNNIENSYYKKLNKTIEQNFCEQARHYEQLSKTNNDLRRFKHDFNNLKIGLTVCYKNNDTEGALRYLEDCSNIISNDYISYHTGNFIVDALLSDKASQIRSRNIRICFEGIIPYNILSPVDICIIFGNALDNAIEACSKISCNVQKVININFKQVSDYIFIKITNPVMSVVNISNNTIVTSKEDKADHGLGIYSIKNTVNKYDGSFNITCNDCVFKLEIGLHMNCDLNK